MKKILLFIWLFSAIISCNKKDPNPDCGCEGKIYGLVRDQVLVYEGGSFTVPAPSSDFFRACNPEILADNIADGDTVVLSGNIHRPCFTGYTLIVQPTPVEVTAIRKK